MNPSESLDEIQDGLGAQVGSMKNSEANSRHPSNQLVKSKSEDVPKHPSNRLSKLKVTKPESPQQKLPTILASEGSDELEDDKVQRNRMSRRFGSAINPNSYQTPQWIRLVALMFAVLIAPMQMLSQGLIKPYEQSLILHLQSESLPEMCVKSSTWCNVLLSSTQYMFNKEESIVMVYILVLMCDSLLSFKSTILTMLGIYGMGMFQLAFKDGRPFWDIADITSNGHCKSSFGSPNESAFIMTFFYPYIMHQFLFKYAPRPPYLLNFTLMIAMVFLWVMVYFQGLVNGTSYIYQCVAG